MMSTIKWFHLEEGLEVARNMIIYNGFSVYDDVVFYYDNNDCHDKIRIALPDLYDEIINSSRDFGNYIDSFRGAGTHRLSHGIEIDTSDCVDALIDKINSGDEYVIGKLDECFTVWSLQTIGDKKSVNTVAWKLMNEQFDVILKGIIKDLIDNTGVKPSWTE